MRRSNPNPRPYLLVPVKTSTEASFRRWNQVLIIMLGLLVVGLLLIAFVPEAGSRSSAASKAPLKIDKDPAPVALEELKNGYARVIDSRTAAACKYLVEG